MANSISTFQAIRPVIRLAVATFLFNFVVQIVTPFMVDVMYEAICLPETECSQVIIMVSAQQMITGFCAIVSAPILGGLSDDYGRKPVLVAIFVASIIPQAILAYNRTKAAVYCWWVFSIIANIVRDGSVVAANFAYVTDVVDETHRPVAMGIITASMPVGFLLGILSTYAMKSEAQAFAVAVIIQSFAAIYLMLFVRETNPRRPLLPAEKGQSEATTHLLGERHLRKHFNNVRETMKTVWASPFLRRLAMIDFLVNFGGVGLRTFALYYLRVAFMFDKDQLATVILVGSLGAISGPMLLYPTVSSVIGQRKSLWIGLLGTAAVYFTLSITWAPWIPYVGGIMEIFGSFTAPAIGTLSSKAVDHEQQGKLQGILSSVKQVAGIIAPLVLVQLTAASLGDNPPLGLRGLPYIVCGFVSVLAWLLSIGLPHVSISEELEKPSEYVQAPMPPEEATEVAAFPEDLHHVPIHSEIQRNVDSQQDKMGRPQ